MQRLLPCSPYLGYLPLFTASGLGGGVLASLALISPALALDQIAAWQFDPVRQQLSITLPPQVTPTYKIRADGRAILLHLPATRLLCFRKQPLRRFEQRLAAEITRRHGGHDAAA